MRPALSSTLAGFGTTIFTEMTRLAVEHGAINLAQGFPDFDGPEFVKEAASRPSAAGRTSTRAMAGLPRAAPRARGEVPAGPGARLRPRTEIVVTTGATEAIAAILVVCEVGRRGRDVRAVLRLLRPPAAMAGAQRRVVQLRAPDWSFEPEALEAAIGPRSAAILVNTPHNPTGKVFRHDELEVIAAASRRTSPGGHRRGLRAPRLRGPPRVDGDAAGHGRAHDHDLVCGKTFSVTGWKVGWAWPAGAHRRPPHGAPVPHLRDGHAVSGGAAAALDAGHDYYAALAADYRGKRDYLVRELSRIGFR